MGDSSDDMQLRRQITLRDGTPALIRPLRPDDRGRIVAAFAQLEPTSIYTRYFTHVKDFTDVLSAVLGVVAWPLILAGVNLHVQ